MGTFVLTCALPQLAPATSLALGMRAAFPWNGSAREMNGYPVQMPRTVTARRQTAQVSSQRLFVGPNVMRRVAAALPKRGRTVAAVAYVTHDHLNLGHEDALAVNASASAVRSGATDPSLLLELHARDVIIVNQAALHAKAILRGGTVAIGSANLSERTSSLQELMWVTSDPTLVRRTARWLQDLLGPAPMDRSELENLVSLYRQDVRPESSDGTAGHEPASSETRRANPFDPKTVRRLWLWRSEPDDMTAPTALGAGAARSDSALTGKEWIRSPGMRDIRRDDVWVRYGHGRLHPPRRVLVARSSARAPDGSRWTLLGFRAGDASVPTPAWVRDAYGEQLRTEDVLVRSDDVANLLSLWA